MLRCCWSLGPLLNDKKLMLGLVQRMEFIGVVRDATCAREFLPQERFQALVNLIAGVSAFPLTMAMVCLRLLGHMAACMYVVCHAKLQRRPLQQWLVTVCSQSRDQLEKVVTTQ